MNEKLHYEDFSRQLSYEQTWCDMSLNKIIFVTNSECQKTKNN